VTIIIIIITGISGADERLDAAAGRSLLHSLLRRHHRSSPQLLRLRIIKPAC
jgi:hypothetical protein